MSFAMHAQRRQLPVQDVPSGSGFVAGAQLLDRTELVHQLSNRLETVGNDPQAANFSTGFRKGDRDSLGMDIQTNKTHFTHRTDSPFACGSAPRLRRVIHATRNEGRSFIFAPSLADRQYEPFGHDD
jgi:hypothetical protein